jgi:hypothetical protein
MLLKVEQDNAKARKLYRKIGYRVVAVDRGAERPEAGPGGVRYVPTVQVAMRKNLLLPLPIDSLVSLAAAAAAAAYCVTQYGSELSEAAALVAGGQLEAALELLLQIAPLSF